MRIGYGLRGTAAGVTEEDPDETATIDAPSGDTSRLVALVEWVLIRLVVADDGWEG